MRPFYIAVIVTLASWSAPAEESACRVHFLRSLDYPAVAAAARLEGSVELEVRVSADGSVAGATVKAGNAILGEAAKTNALSWQFERAPDAGGSAPRRCTLFYAFRITGNCEKATCPTAFSFEFPNRVTTETKARHWQP